MSMTTIKHCFSLLLLLIFFVLGCATRQEFTIPKGTDLHRIGILYPEPQHGIRIEQITTYYGNLGAFGGALGGLLEGSREEIQTRKYHDALGESTEYDFGTYLQEQLSSQLNKKGYTAVVLTSPAKLIKNQAELEKDPTSVDAYLSVYPLYLCYKPASQGFTSKLDYQPSVSLSVTLIEKSTQAVLYADNFHIGPKSRITPSESLNVGDAEDYIYDDLDALLKDAPRSIEGIKVALDLLAKRIADDLMPPR